MTKLMEVALILQSTLFVDYDKIKMKITVNNEI